MEKNKVMKKKPKAKKTEEDKKKLRVSDLEITDEFNVTTKEDGAVAALLLLFDYDFGDPDIQLRDSEVSRRHAVLEIRDPEVTLMDLGSTNGTWFDGAQIETARLGHQDEFTLGSTTLMLIVTPMRDG